MLLIVTIFAVTLLSQTVSAAPTWWKAEICEITEVWVSDGQLDIWFTYNDGANTFHWYTKPGISNLKEILAVALSAQASALLVYFQLDAGQVTGICLVSE